MLISSSLLGPLKNEGCIKPWPRTIELEFSKVTNEPCPTADNNVIPDELLDEPSEDICERPIVWEFNGRKIKQANELKIILWLIFLNIEFSE